MSTPSTPPIKDLSIFLVVLVLSAIVMGAAISDPSNKSVLVFGLFILLPAISVATMILLARLWFGRKTTPDKPKQVILKEVLLLLEKQIGKIDPAIIAQIRQFPVRQLEELSHKAVNFSRIEDLDRWLSERYLN